MQKVLKFVTSILCFYGWCVNFRANFRATNEVIFSYYLTGSRCNIRKQFSNLLDFIHSRTTLFTKFAICLTWMVRSLKRETKNNFQLSILCNSGCAWFWARFYFTTESCVLWVQFINRKLSEMTFFPQFLHAKEAAVILCTQARFKSDHSDTFQFTVTYVVKKPRKTPKKYSKKRCTPCPMVYQLRASLTSDTCQKTKKNSH